MTLNITESAREIRRLIRENNGQAKRNMVMLLALKQYHNESIQNMCKITNLHKTALSATKCIYVEFGIERLLSGGAAYTIWKKIKEDRKPVIERYDQYTFKRLPVVEGLISKGARITRRKIYYAGCEYPCNRNVMALGAEISQYKSVFLKALGRMQ